MSDAFVAMEKSGRIATITLDRRATRNAVASHQDGNDILGALAGVAEDRDVSVLILAAAGPSFSAGGNLKAMRERRGIGPLETPADTRDNYRRGVQAVMRAFADLEVATIAAVHGHAIGLGLDLAAICDLRVASVSAKFASSFVKVGIVPGDGGAWVLQRVLGYPRAAELILTGDTIGASEALAIGLVNRVVEDDQLLSASHELAQRVATNPPRSIRLAKRLLREAQHGRLSDVLELSAAFQALAHETDDHKEAVTAFLEKRPPQFTGA